MKHFDITSDRNFERADRREDFINAMDIDALGPSTLRQIFEDEDALNFEIASGQLYLAHLAHMDVLAADLPALCLKPA